MLLYYHITSIIAYYTHIRVTVTSLHAIKRFSSIRNAYYLHSVLLACQKFIRTCRRVHLSLIEKSHTVYNDKIMFIRISYITINTIELQSELRFANIQYHTNQY